MRHLPRLATGFITGLVAWLSVQLLGFQVFPNATGIASGVAGVAAIGCGLLALPRRSLPLLFALIASMILFGLGYLMMVTARAGYDGPGMAGGMLVIVAALFVFGVAPAAAIHWLLTRIETRLSHPGGFAS